MKRTLPILLILGITLVMAGCSSKLKDKLPVEPATEGFHGAEFMTPTKDGFHGKVLALKQMTLKDCQVCHSLAPDGGTAKRSCFGAGCHAGTHDATMGMPSGPNFHGRQFKAGTVGIPGCLDCHSLEAGGGTIARSCFSVGCHEGSHPKGIANPASADFHAKWISTIEYRIDVCQTCHGVDYNGGVSKASCNTSGCHNAADNGPEACYTCHGDRATQKIYPQTPGHITHLEGGQFTATKVTCSGCHTMPTKVIDPAHFNPSNPVKITDPLALLKPRGFVGDPAYNTATKTCENVYCHGNIPNGNNFKPVWDGQNQAACGTCHGNLTNPRPGGTHPAVDACSGCHAGVVDANRQFDAAGKALHINGKLRLYGSDKADWLQ